MARLEDRIRRLSEQRIAEQTAGQIGFPIQGDFSVNRFSAEPTPETMFPIPETIIGPADPSFTDVALSYSQLLAQVLG